MKETIANFTNAPGIGQANTDRRSGKKPFKRKFCSLSDDFVKNTAKKP
ncbi:MAG: hypothetical protein ACI965_001712 [Paraglaciecola sp.]|jgi:hypothetical protein